MKRYDTIHSLGNCKLVDFELSEYVTGNYISDKSHFTPVSELAKSVVGQSIGKTDLARYDFADGTDNGMTLPVARRRPELAELSVDVRRQQSKVKESVELQQRYDAARKQAEGALKNEASSKE